MTFLFFVPRFIVRLYCIPLSPEPTVNFNHSKLVYVKREKRLMKEANNPSLYEGPSLFQAPRESGPRN